MKFAVVVYETPEHMSARHDPTRAAEYWGAYMAYNKALSDAGVAAGGAGLEPPATATSISMRDGNRVVHDGPFIDSKERLGGFFLIDVANVEEALKWAARCPSVSNGGGVEVRPVLTPPAR